MATFIRYALATFCFAASFGCLALWWRSISDKSTEQMVSYYSKAGAYHVAIFNGQFHAYFASESIRWSEYVGWLAISHAVPEGTLERRSTLPSFGTSPLGYLFPVWYPALIFAFAGVTFLRFRRQFSIRSALIYTTVVAALVGMAVIL